MSSRPVFSADHGWSQVLKGVNISIDRRFGSGYINPHTHAWELRLPSPCLRLWSEFLTRYGIRRFEKGVGSESE